MQEHNCRDLKLSLKTLSAIGSMDSKTLGMMHSLQDFQSANALVSLLDRIYKVTKQVHIGMRMLILATGLSIMASFYLHASTTRSNQLSLLLSSHVMIWRSGSMRLHSCLNSLSPVSDVSKRPRQDGKDTDDNDDPQEVI